MSVHCIKNKLYKTRRVNQNNGDEIITIRDKIFGEAGDKFFKRSLKKGFKGLLHSHKPLETLDPQIPTLYKNLVLIESDNLSSNPLVHP